ncbi:hypothetical protein KUW17_18915 [Leisingera aquaemixtae]|uniref:hypothetical protein n=1 Tax=Leisingera aquaemixtae TaxID=1396826 RepID=UPI001C9408D3|nr:hypothetical protein [Leisingera aquaemixtae]MBY6068822.1 hypothetical protein [Leisingera aquaemixtae]
MNYDDNYRPGRGHRKIVKRSPYHWVGQTTFTAADGRQQAFGFGSYLEYQASLCCIYRPGFLDLEEQLAPVLVRKLSGATAPHWLDFRLTLKSGKRIALAVKPKKFAERYEFRAEMLAVADAAIPAVADELCVVTEQNIDPIEFHNAKLFHSARFPEPVMDEAVAEALKSLRTPTMIRQFLAESGIGPAGFYSVVRAIHKGLAKVASNERIGAATVISGKAIH